MPGELLPSQLPLLLSLSLGVLLILGGTSLTWHPDWRLSSEVQGQRVGLRGHSVWVGFIPEPLIGAVGPLTGDSSPPRPTWVQPAPHHW